MHNWWIASLEHFGLITREEAEHISKEIRLSIHKEDYSEAIKSLEAILGDKFKEPLLSDFMRRLDEVEAKLATIGHNQKSNPKA